MNKIIKKIKTFYGDNEQTIKIVTGGIMVGLATALLIDNIRMKDELRDVMNELNEASEAGKEVLKNSQTKVRELVENNKKGTEEWHNEVMQSTYCIGGLDLINTVMAKLNKL